MNSPVETSRQRRDQQQYLLVLQGVPDSSSNSVLENREMREDDRGADCGSCLLVKVIMNQLSGKKSLK